MDIIPQRNLPDPAQPWGRHMEKVATGNADDIAKTNQRVTITNQNTASAIGALQDQIAALVAQQNSIIAQQAYLSNLRTYSLTSTNTISWSTGVAGAWVSDTAVPFTLNAPSTVLVTYTFNLKAVFGGTGSGGSSSLACYVDGVLNSSGSVSLNFAISQPSSISGSGAFVGVYTGTFTLAAGAHTITGAYFPGAGANSPAISTGIRALTVQVVSSP